MSYGYGSRQDPPARTVPAGDPGPRLNAPTSAESRGAQALPGSGHVGEATAGILRSEDFLFVIDLDEGRITTFQDEGVPGAVFGRLTEEGEDPVRYGFEIYDESGDVIIGADGLGVGVVGGAQLIPGSITEIQLAEDAVTETRIAPGAVTQIRLAENAVGSLQLAPNSVTATRIAEGAVEEIALAPGSVTTTRIQEGAVVTETIADGAVVAGKIFAGTITSAEIATGTITAANILGGTITAQEIAANAITATEIAADTITANEIAAGAITADEIQAETITGDLIQGETITGDLIAGNTITADNIFGSTITAEELAANSVGTEQLQAGSVTADEIEAGTITANELSSNEVSALFATVGILEAGILRSSDERIAFDLDGAQLVVTDGNATIRGVFGNLGPGPEDWGFEVYDASGELIVGATGLGIDVVGTQQIQDAAITTAQIEDAAITTAKIDELDASVITTGFLSADVLEVGSINGNVLEVGSITGDRVGFRQLTGDRIGTNQITATEVQANTITANEIAANTITADEIEAGTITTDLIDAGAITADLIEAGAISTEKISASEGIDASRINAERLDAFTAILGEVEAGVLTSPGGTAAILLGGAFSLPSGVTRYLNLTAENDEPFLRHEDLELRADGTRQWPSEVLNPPSITSLSKEDSYYDTGFNGHLFDVEFTISENTPSDWRLDFRFFREGSQVASLLDQPLTVSQPVQELALGGSASDEISVQIELYDPDSDVVADIARTRPTTVQSI